MATFSFDGSTSQTTAFNATVDRVVFNLDASELASISEDRANNTVTIVATSGAVLTLTGTNFLALTPTSLVPGFDSDIVFGIGTDSPETLNGNVLVGLDGADTLDSTVPGAIDGALIFGNAGNDEIYAAGQNVRIYGGMDGDSVTLENRDAGSASLIVGGLGEDNLFISGGTEIVTDPEFPEFPFEESRGYSGSLTVFGGNEAGDPTDGADTIDVELAGSATAAIFGNGGADSIEVNTESDFTGSVSVYGGQGDDEIDIELNGISSALVIGGLGEDAIFTALEDGASVTVFGGNGAADAADGSDLIFLDQDGDTSSAVAYGNGGDDVILIDDGMLVQIFGGQGNDYIGRDLLGNNFFDQDATGEILDGSVIYGGLGIDQIDVIAEGVGASVTVYGGNGEADATDSADVITVRLATDSENVNGVDLPPVDQTAMIFGNAGNDIITLTGGGSATVFGGAGNDTIVLGRVEEEDFDGPVEIEQTGQHVLTGGAGNDRFDLSQVSEATTEETLSAITDFTFGQDTIVFNSLVDSTTVGRATLATATDLQAIITAGGPIDNQVAVITVTGGDLAGSYAVSGEQVIDITGFTGTINASAFSGQNAGPIIEPLPPVEFI